MTPYILVLKFNISYFFVTYLNSETPTDDENLEILAYHIFSADTPSNNKTECFYLLNSVKYLSFRECITFELKISDKVCYFIHPYKSASLTQDKFQMLK